MTVEIIAEAAQGFEGDVTQARLLARAAARSGADAVKFQLVYADELATPGYRYYDLFRNLEMSSEAWKRVAEEARSGNIRLYFDVYGDVSLKQAVEWGADGIKISTTDFNNSRLVAAALQTRLRLFVSVGGISMGELDEFVSMHGITPERSVCFMYGFQAEPTPIESNNLRKLAALRQRFPGFKFGFMDHSDGGTDESQSLALLALPLGVECIEKHLTLDRALELEDYVSALAPAQFREFAARIKHLESALGTDSLELTTVEQEYRRKAIKTVVANAGLRRGQVIGADDTRLKRVASPVPPGAFDRIEQVVGRTLTTDILYNQVIVEDALS